MTKVLTPLQIKFFCLFIFLSSQIMFGQEIVIHGKVRHANTYRDIPNVNIYVKNTNVGTTTNISGMFTLKIHGSQPDAIIVFEHISYYPVEIPLSEAQDQRIFYLHPRVIELPEISVVVDKALPYIVKDIPIAFRVIESKNFDVQGFVDAGDLLRTDQSIQVKENLSGKKTVAIRGGNPDDVLVLFNGIRMNSLYDNVFDFSLINLEDIKQLEIIRGGNTSLYGAEATSGIINVIPKTQRNYKFRFQQKIGTYASGDWSLNLNHHFFKKLNLSYSYKQGGMTRKYPGSENVDKYLKNTSSYHNASVVYDLHGRDRSAENNISLMYLRSNLDYFNNRINEKMSDFNQVISLRFAGDIGWFRNINLAASYQTLNNEQFISIDTLFFDRHFLSHSTNLNFEKDFRLQDIDLILAYQFENSELDYQDKQEISDLKIPGIESALLTRQRNGLVAIFKWNMPDESELYKRTGIDVSYRYDAIKTRYKNIEQRTPTEEFQISDHDWHKSMLKFSSNIVAGTRYLNVNAYLNYGTNYKFPTMFQQMSLPSLINVDPRLRPSNLDAEKNTSLQLGADIIKETHDNPNMNGFQISASLFRNNYTNKIRMYYVPYSPIAFYDNVQNAEISGIEAKLSLFLFQKKLTLEFGTSNYSIPEKAAFPFKSSHKHIFNILFDHAGYSLQINWFYESDQVGWLCTLDGSFEEIALPGYKNFDLHVNKQFEIYKFKLFANFSGRNLLDDDTDLEGITIRDRRFYVTLGFQY